MYMLNILVPRHKINLCNSVLCRKMYTFLHILNIFNKISISPTKALLEEKTQNLAGKEASAHNTGCTHCAHVGIASALCKRSWSETVSTRIFAEICF